jgi:tetratricopeptide (TPR) repeat protein
MNDPAAHESAATPAVAVALAEEHLHRGEPVLAYNAAQSGLIQWPGHVRLRQLQGLALARSGDVEGANLLLMQLTEEGHGDAETLGMLARTHKDLALAATNDATRGQRLEAGFRLYARAFEDARRSGSDADAYYSGINAATMAVLKGELERARGIAREVRAICERAGPAGSDESSRYWTEATLGEAALIIGDIETAAAHYARAVELAGTRFGDVSSTRRQFRLLAAHLPGVGAACADSLRIPPVLVFTGHMIDRADRATPRFPAAIETAVHTALTERLAVFRPVAVYGSAACGTDILCLEAARELGCETHVVLPFPAAEFRGSSVDFARGNWGERFERALAAADSVTVASDHRASGSAATFEYANLILTGMGKLRAEALDTNLRGLAIWDPQIKGYAGGAASLVSLWEQSGLTVEQVHPHWFHEIQCEAPIRPAEPAGSSGPVRHEMRALLFADAVGYSQLSEDQIPGFITGFLEAVAGLNRRTAHRFEHVETSGDGLYMVFRDVRDAGLYALELSALMRSSDRQAWGLPANFDLRIAAHCGPVHCGRDPVTGGNLYTGPHTSRAARIEPITPPGQVYASSAFAAVAAATGVDGMTMRYVGRIPLAKGYGTLGLYCVRPVD